MSDAKCCRLGAGESVLNGLGRVRLLGLVEVGGPIGGGIRDKEGGLRFSGARPNMDENGDNT